MESASPLSKSVPNLASPAGHKFAARFTTTAPPPPNPPKILSLEEWIPVDARSGVRGQGTFNVCHPRIPASQVEFVVNDDNFPRVPPPLPRERRSQALVNVHLAHREDVLPLEIRLLSARGAHVRVLKPRQLYQRNPIALSQRYAALEDEPSSCEDEEAIDAPLAPKRRRLHRAARRQTSDSDEAVMARSRELAKSESAVSGTPTEPAAKRTAADRTSQLLAHVDDNILMRYVANGLDRQTYAIFCPHSNFAYRSCHWALISIRPEYQDVAETAGIDQVMLKLFTEAKVYFADFMRDKAIELAIMGISSFLGVMVNVMKLVRTLIYAERRTMTDVCLDVFAVLSALTTAGAAYGMTQTDGSFLIKIQEFFADFRFLDKTIDVISDQVNGVDSAPPATVTLPATATSVVADLINASQPTPLEEAFVTSDFGPLLGYTFEDQPMSGKNTCFYDAVAALTGATPIFVASLLNLEHPNEGYEYDKDMAPAKAPEHLAALGYRVIWDERHGDQWCNFSAGKTGTPIVLRLENAHWTHAVLPKPSASDPPPRETKDEAQTSIRWADFDLSPEEFFKVGDVAEAAEESESWGRASTAIKCLGGLISLIAALCGFDHQAPVRALSQSLTAARSVTEMIMQVAEDFFGVDVSGKKKAQETAKALSAAGEEFLSLAMREVVGSKLKQMAEWKKNAETFVRTTKSKTINTSDLSAILSKVTDRICKARMADADVVQRPVTAGFYVHGPAEHGKTSFITNYVIPKLNFIYGLSEDQGRVYHLGAGAHFQSTRGEPWGFADEYGAAEDPGITESQYNQIMSCAPCVIPGAAIEDKEQHAFFSALFFLTNFEWIHLPQHKTNDTTRAAFRSRCKTFYVLDTKFSKASDRDKQPHRKSDFTHLRIMWQNVRRDAIPHWLAGKKQWMQDQPYECDIELTPDEVVRLISEDIDGKQAAYLAAMKSRTTVETNPAPRYLWSPASGDRAESANTRTPVVWISGAPGLGKTQTIVPALTTALETFNYTVRKQIVPHPRALDAFILDDQFDPTTLEGQKAFKDLYDACSPRNVIVVICNYGSPSWTPSFITGVTPIKDREIVKGFERRSGLGTPAEFRWEGGKLWRRRPAYPLPALHFSSVGRWLSKEGFDLPDFVQLFTSEIARAELPEIKTCAPPDVSAYDAVADFHQLPGEGEFETIRKAISFQTVKGVQFSALHFGALKGIGEAASSEGLKSISLRLVEYILRHEPTLNLRVRFPGATYYLVNGEMYACETGPARVSGIDKTNGTFNFRTNRLITGTKDDIIKIRSGNVNREESNELIAHLILEKASDTLDWQLLSQTWPPSWTETCQSYFDSLKTTAVWLKDKISDHPVLLFGILVVALAIFMNRPALQPQACNRCSCDRWPLGIRATTVCPRDVAEAGRAGRKNIKVNRVPVSAGTGPIHCKTGISFRGESVGSDGGDMDAYYEQWEDVGTAKGQAFWELSAAAMKGKSHHVIESGPFAGEYGLMSHEGELPQWEALIGSNSRNWRDRAQCAVYDRDDQAAALDKIRNQVVELWIEGLNKPFCYTTMITPTVGVTVRHATVTQQIYLKHQGKRYPVIVLHEDMSRETAVIGSNIPLPGIKDIRNKLVNYEDARRYTGDATVLIRDGSHRGRFQFLERVTPAMNDDQLTCWGNNIGYVAYGTAQTCPTGQGLCGSPVLLEKNGDYRIVGVHAASRRFMSRLACTIVSAQSFNQAISHYKMRLDQGETVSTLEIPAGYVEMPELSAHGEKVVTPKVIKDLILAEPTTPRHFEPKPEWALKPVGYLNCKKPMYPKSPPHQMQYFTETLADMDRKVPVLNEHECYKHLEAELPADQRGAKFVYMKRLKALAANHAHSRPPNIRERAKELGKYFNSLLPGKQLNPLSVREVIAGSARNKCIEPRSSLGWFTTTITGATVKGDVVDIVTGEFRDNGGGRWLKEVTDTQWDLAGREIRVTYPSETQAKMETRPEGKEWNPRFIQIVALPININAQRVFGPAQDFFSRMGMKSPLLFSIDPLKDWDALYQGLVEFTDKFAGIDVSAFDMSQSEEVLLAVGDMVFELYVDQSAQGTQRPTLRNRIRTIMLEHAAMPVQLRETLIKAEGGVKSGFQATSFIDASAWLIYIYAAWYESVPAGRDKSASRFFAEVVTRGIGDDLAFGVKEEVEPYFNHKVLTAWLEKHTLMKVTSMAKDGSEIVAAPIRELEFCSRKFVPLHNHSSRIIPHIKESSITGALEWCRNPRDLREFYYTAVQQRSTLLPYGPKKFRVFERELAALANEAGITDHVAFTHEDYAEYLWSALGVPEKDLHRATASDIHSWRTKTERNQAIEVHRTTRMSKQKMKTARANLRRLAMESKTIDEFWASENDWKSSFNKIEANLIDFSVYTITRPGTAAGPISADLPTAQTDHAFWLLTSPEHFRHAAEWLMTWKDAVPATVLDPKTQCLPNSALRWNFSRRVAHAAENIIARLDAKAPPHASDPTTDWRFVRSILAQAPTIKEIMDIFGTQDYAEAPDPNISPELKPHATTVNLALKECDKDAVHEFLWLPVEKNPMDIWFEHLSSTARALDKDVETFLARRVEDPTASEMYISECPDCGYKPSAFEHPSVAPQWHQNGRRWLRCHEQAEQVAPEWQGPIAEVLESQPEVPVFEYNDFKLDIPSVDEEFDPWEHSFRDETQGVDECGAKISSGTRYPVTTTDDEFDPWEWPPKAEEPTPPAPVRDPEDIGLCRWGPTRGSWLRDFHIDEGLRWASSGCGPDCVCEFCAMLNSTEHQLDQAESSIDPAGIVPPPAAPSSASSGGAASGLPNLAEQPPGVVTAPAIALPAISVDAPGSASGAIFQVPETFPAIATQMCAADPNDLTKAFEYNELALPAISSKQARGTVIAVIAWNPWGYGSTTAYMRAVSNLGLQASGTMWYQMSVLSGTGQNGSILVAYVPATYRNVPLTTGFVRALDGCQEISLAGPSRIEIPIVPTANLMSHEDGFEMWPTKESLDKDPWRYGKIVVMIGTDTSTQFNVDVPMPITIKARFDIDFMIKGSRIMRGESGGGNNGPLPYPPTSSSFILDSGRAWFPACTADPAYPFTDYATTVRPEGAAFVAMPFATDAGSAWKADLPGPDADTDDWREQDKQGPTLRFNWGQLDPAKGDGSRNMYSYAASAMSRGTSWNLEVPTFKDDATRALSTAVQTKLGGSPYIKAGTSAHMHFDGNTIDTSLTQVRHRSQKTGEKDGVHQYANIKTSDDCTAELEWSAYVDDNSNRIISDEDGSAGVYTLTISNKGAQTLWFVDPAGEKLPGNWVETTHIDQSVSTNKFPACSDANQIDGNRFGLKGGFRCTTGYTGTPVVPQGYTALRPAGKAKFIPGVAPSVKGALTMPPTTEEYDFKRQLEAWYASKDRDCESYTAQMVLINGDRIADVLFNQHGMFVRIDEDSSAAFYALSNTLGVQFTSFSRFNTEWAPITEMSREYILPRTVASGTHAFLAMGQRKLTIVRGPSMSQRAIQLAAEKEVEDLQSEVRSLKRSIEAWFKTKHEDQDDRAEAPDVEVPPGEYVVPEYHTTLLHYPRTIVCSFCSRTFKNQYAYLQHERYSWKHLKKIWYTPPYEGQDDRAEAAAEGMLYVASGAAKSLGEWMGAKRDQRFAMKRINAAGQWEVNKAEAMGWWQAQTEQIRQHGANYRQQAAFGYSSYDKTNGAAAMKPSTPVVVNNYNSSSSNNNVGAPNTSSGGVSSGIDGILSAAGSTANPTGQRPRSSRGGVPPQLRQRRPANNNGQFSNSGARPTERPAGRTYAQVAATPSTSDGIRPASHRTPGPVNSG